MCLSTARIAGSAARFDAVLDFQRDAELHRRNTGAVEAFGADLREQPRARRAHQVGVEAIGAGDVFRMRDHRVEDRRRRRIAGGDRGRESSAALGDRIERDRERRQAAAIDADRDILGVDAHPLRQRRQRRAAASDAAHGDSRW